LTDKRGAPKQLPRRGIKKDAFGQTPGTSGHCYNRTMENGSVLGAITPMQSVQTGFRRERLNRNGSTEDVSEKYAAEESKTERTPSPLVSTSGG